MAQAKVEDKRLGRPLSLDEEQITAIRQYPSENMTVAAISKKYGITRTTLRDNIERIGEHDRVTFVHNT